MSLYDEVHHKYKLACTELREATDALDDPAVNNIRTLPEGIRLLRAENERLRGLLRVVLAEVTPGVRPHSTDSYLPEHIVDQITHALAGAADAAREGT